MQANAILTQPAIAKKAYRVFKNRRLRNPDADRLELWKKCLADCREKEDRKSKARDAVARLKAGFAHVSPLRIAITYMKMHYAIGKEARIKEHIDNLALSETRRALPPAPARKEKDVAAKTVVAVKQNGKIREFFSRLLKSGPAATNQTA